VNLKLLATLGSRFMRNNRELKFAIIHVTTRCNAKCVDRCNIWASPPIDMTLNDVLFTIDVLAKNNFSVAYFTGGETGLYPYLVEAINHAKDKGLITSITTNGSISKENIAQLTKSLDALSVSVDHYNLQLWDEAKHVPGISQRATETIRLAKAYGIKLYAVTFLNPYWNTSDITKMVHYVNDELGIPFAFSYPYISSNDGTFKVGGKLRMTRNDFYSNIRNNVAKILELKLAGAQVANTTGYLREVLRAHDNLPLKYPCKAGQVILTVDCNLNIYPCYKKDKLLNLRENQNINFQSADNSSCDNKYCMINCFKEASEASRATVFSLVKEEMFSNPEFFRSFLH
jgi:MoaA/NifB/PqqE/SkfB family radical SAM enzyme